MKILIKFPSRGRPSQFKNVLKKYLENLSGKHQVRFVFSFDLDDTSMNNQDVRDYLNGLNIDHKANYGNNKNKIQAINADLENEKFDVLILASDDMIPTINGYDDEIVKRFESSGLGLDCMLHTHSTRWSYQLDIGCIMGWHYYKRFNYIYHPSYKSIFVDIEYTEVSKILNRNVFTNEFTPFYHDWKGGDATEIKNFEFNNQDYRTFEERRKKNYDLPL